MISHRTEERLLGVLSFVGIVGIVGATIWLLVAFGRAWRSGNIADEVGYATIIILLNMPMRLSK